MNAIDLKAELKRLIESETDMSILESLKTLLQKTRLDKTMKEALTNRALLSEEDIKAGRVMDRSELERRLK